MIINKYYLFSFTTLCSIPKRINITDECIFDYTNWSVRNQGVIFDQCINMYKHVTSVCRAAHYHLKNIDHLKAFLTQQALVTAVHGSVTSWIDYCNSLFCGIAYYKHQSSSTNSEYCSSHFDKYSKIWSYHHNSSKPILASCWTAYPFQDFTNTLYTSINDVASECLC